MKHHGHVIQQTRLDGVIDTKVALVLNVTLNDDQLAVKVTVLRLGRREQLATHRRKHRRSHTETVRQNRGHHHLTPLRKNSTQNYTALGTAHTYDATPQ